MPPRKDPIAYDPEKDNALIVVPKDIPVKPMSDIQAEVKMYELAGTVQPLDIPPLINKETNTFTRPRTRMPSYEECEVLGGLVAMGMPLENACSLLTPPLRYEKVERCLRENFKRRTIYRRAQSKWLYNSLQLLLTREPKEITGLIFILKNRHGKLFDGGNRLKLDVTSAGSPLQLTSPEVIERARIYASQPQQVIDVDTIDNDIDTNTSASLYTQENIHPPPSSFLHTASITQVKNNDFGKEISSSRSPTPPDKSIEFVSSSSFYDYTEENLSNGTPTVGSGSIKIEVPSYRDIMAEKPKSVQRIQYEKTLTQKERENIEFRTAENQREQEERAKAYLDSLVNSGEEEEEEEE